MNPKGKMFADSLVLISSNNEILLDIPKVHVQNVKKLIEFSILRMEASLLVENELNVFASISSESSLSLKDTRFSDYEVYRHYSKENSTCTDVARLYKSFELLNGVWSTDDNIKNLHAGTVNLDLLQGASKSKGCYVGQEVYNSYINHHKTPTRIIPVVIDLKSNSQIEMSKKEACEGLEVSELFSQDYSGLVNQQIKEGEKDVGKVLFVQPHSRIGLALCEAYQPAQSQWSVGDIRVTPVHLNVC